MPDVNFDIAEMYSGHIALDNNGDRNLFVHLPSYHWYASQRNQYLAQWRSWLQFPRRLLQRERSVCVAAWRFAPVRNPYARANLTLMLWVEFPVGVGFSTGKATASAQAQQDIAADFHNFFQKFEDLFSVHSYKIYVTGESYAGRYVPYISAVMLNQKASFDVVGALVYDPCIGDCNGVQSAVPIVPFV